jgi:hypothetical protein
MTLDPKAMLRTIGETAQGLLFPSESDFPIEPFFLGADEPTPEDLLAHQGLAPDTPVEETTFDCFFDGLTDAPSDASGTDRETAARFRSLKVLLEQSLEDIRVYRVGEIDIEVFVLGRHPSGTWLGVRTNVVET